MNLLFSADEEEWRQEVKSFLDQELPEDSAFDTEFCEDQEKWAFALEFNRKVAAKGWIGLTWPAAYGGLERPVTERTILFEELTRRNAPLVNQIGWGLAAGSLLYGGTEEQKRYFLPRIARFEEFWVEGLTEPSSGSDLASLTTRAVRNGSDWIITGQKTYTTWGHHGDVMYLAARTNPEPRHRGISIFCLDMKLPGVSFSPLLNLGGGRQNHTYLDEVRVPGDMLIGEEGMGWSYVMNAFYGGGGGGGGRHVKLEIMLEKVVRYCQMAVRGGRPLIEDPIIRSKLAELALMAESERLLSYEVVGNATQNRAPQFGGAMPVVVSKEIQPRFAQICTQIVGSLAQLADGNPWSPLGGSPEAWYRQSFANHAGGTPQVKRMVLATRGLGLPR